MKKCDEYFSCIKEADFIYAGQLKSKLAINIKTAYEILEELKEQGFLVNVYEVYCFGCDKSKGVFLDSIEEFNPDFHCDFCDNRLSIYENIIVLYKVIKV